MISLSLIIRKKVFPLVETFEFLHGDLRPELVLGNIHRIIQKHFDIFSKLFPCIGKHQRNYRFFATHGVNIVLNYTVTQLRIKNLKNIKLKYRELQI